jgi:hypothetical protein
VISHHTYLLLGDPSRCPAYTCQRAILLFGTFDLSIPRLLIAGELDQRFAWPSGSAQKLLNWLRDNDILVSLAHGRLSAGGQTLFVISQDHCWTPRSLMEQWEREELARDRAEVADQE